MYETLIWSEFLKESLEFLKTSQRLGDDWELVQKDDVEGNAYLVYKQKISISYDHGSNEDTLISNSNTKELLQIEYHIVYSISYQVPVLYFRAHKHDGSLIGLEDAWRIFSTYDEDNDSTTLRSRTEMLSILTQMDHPVLFQPYLALHPCRTAELLGQAGKSHNRVLTFISLMGPFVQLQLRNEYGQMPTTITE